MRNVRRGAGSVFPRQHDRESVELVADGPERDFRKGEVRERQFFGFQDSVVSVGCC